MQTFRLAAMRNGIVFLSGMLLSAAAFANFPEDYQAAQNLYIVGKHAEAEQAFLKLAGTQPKSRALDKCFAAAADCAAAEKHYDQALAYAGKIQDPAAAKACRVSVLTRQQKWDDLLAIVRDEDFANWPEDLIYDAYVNRGRAFARKQDAARSEADFRAAIAHTITEDNKAMALLLLGEMFVGVAGDNAKALDAYAQVLPLAADVPVRRVGEAVRARAAIFTAQGQHAQALAELDRMQVETLKDPVWRTLTLIAYGDTYESMGKTAEALARYKAAAAVEKAPEAFTQIAQKKIEALEKK